MKKKSTFLVGFKGLRNYMFKIATLSSICTTAIATPSTLLLRLPDIQTKILAEQISLSGKVLMADNSTGLPGVTVMASTGGVQKQGTTTNENGEFTISDLQTGVKYDITFSYIGYENHAINGFSITDSNKNSIKVILKESISTLNELVVVGYGSTVKKDITGSVKSLKSSEFNMGVITSPEQLFQGKVSGVNITSASGEPGGNVNITVRGPGSVRTGSTPLFVVDGMALDNSATGGATNPLTYMNPQDIESIDVLKDASATAIYGSRGANGVVLITTKRGKSGRTMLDYSGSIGFSKIARSLDVLNAADFKSEAAKLGATVIDKGADTDWQKEVSRVATTQNHNISMSGGTDKLSFFGSFGAQKQQGILKNSQLDKYSGRINLNQKLLDDRLSIDVNLNASNTQNERPPIEALVGGSISANPTFPARNEDGTPYKYQDATNPLITLALERDITTTNRIIGSISPSLTITKGLVYKLNFGIDNATSTQDLQSLASLEPKQDGRLETINRHNSNKLIENYLTYSYNNAKHNFSILVGHSFQKIFIQSRTNSVNKFPITDIEPIYNPGLGQEITLVNNKPSGFTTVNELQSFFSRLNYQFNDKYLATATIRVDGSSKFGDNNKYGVFPSFSLGWRISEEEFLKNGPFSDLKLRAGWGKTGNQEIPSKITQALFSSSVSGTTSYPIFNNKTYPAGTTYSRLANPNIKWEMSTQTDIGLDFALLKGSLSGSIDYFNKVSRDILLEVIPADPVQPAGTFWTNVADMQIVNKGLEMELDFRKALNNGFRYGISGNITFINNEVKKSPYSVIPSGSAAGPGLSATPINGYLSGHPIGSFYLKEFIGFDDKGLNAFRDVNGDGIITDSDRIIAGTALPDKMFNINGNIGYKGFDFSVNFNGVSGNKVYDNTANGNSYKLRLSKGLNITHAALTEPTESINNSAPVSTRYLKDASYFRLNNMSLGYQLNTQQLGIDKWVRTLRVSVTAQNLFLWTKYDGYDPEVTKDRTINGVTSYGIDYLSFPKAKTVTFGINIGL